MPHLSSSDSSLVSLDWGAEEGTEQAHPKTAPMPIPTSDSSHAYLNALCDLILTLLHALTWAFV